MHSNLSKPWKTLYFLAIPFVWGIIYTNTSCFTTYFALDSNALRTYPNIKFLICITFYFMAIMTFICHTLSMITDSSLLDKNIISKLKDKDKTFCKKCSSDRPQRAHHCSTCGKCILKMDHHCPWIFNCVGYYNQKTFFLFLSYATIGDFISFLCVGSRILDPYFVHMILYPRRRYNPNANMFFEILKMMKDPLWIIIGTCLSFAMTIAIGSLLSRQIYLIMNNLTNVETCIYEENEECPYYAPTWKDKWLAFKTVIGLGKKWKWFFPVFEYNKFNGGYNFEVPYHNLFKEMKNRKKDEDGDNGKEKKKKEKKWYRCCC